MLLVTWCGRGYTNVIHEIDNVAVRCGFSRGAHAFTVQPASLYHAKYAFEGAHDSNSACHSDFAEVCHHDNRCHRKPSTCNTQELGRPPAVRNANTTNTINLSQGALAGHPPGNPTNLKHIDSEKKKKNSHNQHNTHTAVSSSSRDKHT